MLTGTFRHTLDAKGRVIIPARFREDLGAVFMVTRGMDKCLTLYSEADFEALQAKLKESPSAATRTVVRYLIGSAHPLELDNNGRAVIPPNLREFAGLEKDVVIMGVSDRVEIWDSKEWDAMEASVCTEDVTKLMIELGL
jgi:MraZ protein